jgi:hypothetical protein
MAFLAIAKINKRNVEIYSDLHHFNGVFTIKGKIENSFIKHWLEDVKTKSVTEYKQNIEFSTNNFEGTFVGCYPLSETLITYDYLDIFDTFDKE